MKSEERETKESTWNYFSSSGVWDQVFIFQLQTCADQKPQGIPWEQLRRLQERQQTPQLLSHGSSFLSYRSKFRNLNIFLADGIEQELLSKISLTDCAVWMLSYDNIQYFLLREKPFGLFRSTLVMETAEFRVIMLNLSQLKCSYRHCIGQATHESTCKYFYGWENPQDENISFKYYFWNLTWDG